ncbi:MAG: D-tyrosyl-tRNA(Tyr) deacylase [Firmicutes bacterium]|nr:D-tyrosyl-tRNA(Tyr) deacylase [Bacillota bacterium]
MRAVVQRVSRAEVRVAGERVSSIGRGFLVLVGVRRGDGSREAAYMAEKILHLRLFPDGEGRLNRSLREAGGSLLVVSQFTLYGDARRGRRPSFSEAAPAAEAEPVFRELVERLAAGGVEVATGRYQAEMSVELVNEGPVTLLLDSDRLF